MTLQYYQTIFNSGVNKLRSCCVIVLRACAVGKNDGTTLSCGQTELSDHFKPEPLDRVELTPGHGMVGCIPYSDEKLLIV